MRLALVCTEKLPVPPVRGGAIQTYIAGVLPYLRENHEVTIVSITDPALPDRDEVDGIRFVRVPRGDTPDHYCRHAAAALSDRCWDLVEIFNRPAFVTKVAAAAPGARVVLSMHNDMFQPERISPQHARECLEATFAVVTISDYIRDGILGMYPEYAAKMRTVRSGVDLNRFSPRWNEVARRTALRGEFGLGKRQVILAVTRLSEKKGVHVLLEAMEQVLRTHPRALLLVVGSRWYGTNEEDDYVREMRRRAKSLGDGVRLIGYVPYDRMPEIFLLGDLFVCASQWQEPLARVHYEAMSTGLPIITTDRGGNAEVIEEGRNGLIVRPHDSPDAFAAAIQTMLDDWRLRSALGRRGRRLAASRYGWDRVARELLEVLEGRWP